MSTGGVAGGVVAAAVAAKRKRIYSRFREGNATTISTARPLKELDVSDSSMLRLLIRHGEVVKVAGDRYYLDETAVEAGRKKRMMAMAGAFMILLIAWILARVL